ncbi:hypothetical protein [Luteolibacter sp. AS25]|uniref:hypothetical protein n=1 Tax=Luteolibacter sp. AS25 TaxID=3135776 RepID=UPI00398B04CC
MNIPEEKSKFGILFRIVSVALCLVLTASCLSAQGDTDETLVEPMDEAVQPQEAGNAPLGEEAPGVDEEIPVEAGIVPAGDQPVVSEDAVGVAEEQPEISGEEKVSMLPELEEGEFDGALEPIPTGPLVMEGLPNPDSSPMVPLDMATGQPVDVTPEYPAGDGVRDVEVSEVARVPVSISEFSSADFGGYEYYLGGIPTGFGKGPPGSDLNTIGRGLTLGGSVAGSYESNVTQGSGDVGSPIDSDFILGVGGTVSYLSTARKWTFGARYTGDYEYYFENPDFSGFNQSLGLMANFEGSKLSATIGAGLTYQRGANRYVGVSNFVEQTSASVGGSASYQLGPRTSIRTTLTYTRVKSSGGDFEDTDSFGAELVGLFQYSAITEFGPGLRFGFESSGGNDRTAIGPTFNINYKLSEKIFLSSRIGLDFVDYSDEGSSGTDVSALLAVNWKPSKLWGMDLTFYRGTTADPFVSGAFNEISSLSLGYSRKIRRVDLRLGASYEILETVGNSGGGGLDSGSDYFSLNASAGIRIFKDSTDLSVFIKYNDLNGGDAASFDNTIVGFSINKTF